MVCNMSYILLTNLHGKQFDNRYKFYLLLKIEFINLYVNKIALMIVDLTARNITFYIVWIDQILILAHVSIVSKVGPELDVYIGPSKTYNIFLEIKYILLNNI